MTIPVEHQLTLGSDGFRSSPADIDRARSEQWLERRLLQHGVQAIGGVTDGTESRKERFRSAIRDNGLTLVVCAATGGRKPEFYGQAFERIYGEKL